MSENVIEKVLDTDAIDDVLSDEVASELRMENGVNPSTVRLTTKRITLQGFYKTGDGRTPYDPSKSGYESLKDMKNSFLFDSGEGRVDYPSIECNNCGEWTELEKVKEMVEEDAVESNFTCPECGAEGGTQPSLPKFIYFKEVRGFDEKVESLDDLEKELKKLDWEEEWIDVVLEEVERIMDEMKKEKR